MSSKTLSCLLEFDAKEKKNVRGPLAGVDEAGRGPLAGPVVAAAVILSDHRPEWAELNDSKMLREAKRERLFFMIVRTCKVGLGVVDEKQIDVLNIYQASRLAMKKAVLALQVQPALLLIDGKASLDLPHAQKTLVQGDRRSASIAAASIIAKVYRDAHMKLLDALYPAYGFKKHKGYGTKLHIERMMALGPLPVHRSSFAPVRKAAEGLRCEIVV